jgi:hypothetical protein
MGEDRCLDHSIREIKRRFFLRYYVGVGTKSCVATQSSSIFRSNFAGLVLENHVPLFGRRGNRWCFDGSIDEVQSYSTFALPVRLFAI